MTEFDNTLKPVAKDTLKTLVGAKLHFWGQPFPQDGCFFRQRVFEHIKLETSKGSFVMSLIETSAFPETCSMEILREPDWAESIKDIDSVIHPTEWHTVKIDRMIQSLRVYCDTGTDIRSAAPDQIVVRDTCGIAFILDDGTALLFEKTYSGSEVWDVSRPEKGDIRLSGRSPGNIVSETL